MALVSPLVRIVKYCVVRFTFRRMMIVIVGSRDRIFDRFVALEIIQRIQLYRKRENWLTVYLEAGGMKVKKKN